MTRVENELLITQGGLQIPTGATNGYFAQSDASGNVSWGPKVSTGAMLYFMTNNITGRAHRDGTSVDLATVLGGSFAGAVASASMIATGTDSTGAAFMVWANTDGNTIGRAKLDGSGFTQSLVTGCSKPVGVTTDGTFVYWTNFNSDAGNTIGRAKIDGTSVNQSFISAGTAPFGIASDANFIYWTNINNGLIGRATLAGGSINTSFITTGWSSVGQLSGIGVDATHIYATNVSGGVGRANLDGTSWNATLISAGNAPSCIDVKSDGSTFIYYVAFSGPGYIGRANLDGSSPNGTWFSTSSGAPIRGVALDTGPLT